MPRAFQSFGCDSVIVVYSLCFMDITCGIVQDVLLSECTLNCVVMHTYKTSVLFSSRSDSQPDQSLYPSNVTGVGPRIGTIQDQSELNITWTFQI